MIEYKSKTYLDPVLSPRLNVEPRCPSTSLSLLPSVVLLSRPSTYHAPSPLICPVYRGLCALSSSYSRLSFSLLSPFPRLSDFPSFARRIPVTLCNLALLRFLFKASIISRALSYPRHRPTSRTRCAWVYVIKKKIGKEREKKRRNVRRSFHPVVNVF